MARLILCRECKEKTEKSSLEFKEHFVCAGGISKKDLECDHCGDELEEGAIANACCLLPSGDDYNADSQHPSRWAGHYIEVGE